MWRSHTLTPGFVVVAGVVVDVVEAQGGQELGFAKLIGQDYEGVRFLNQFGVELTRNYLNGVDEDEYWD